MPTRLPSLTALRAFEAAARHLSFSAAAAELAVTPAALSFQIKGLEEALGAPLFIRRARAVELTEAGRALAPEASRGFEALGVGWLAAQRTTDTRRLTVTAGPGFTTKWLAPSVGRFNDVHRDIELRFVSSPAKLDFARDGIDLAVRSGTGEDPGLFRQPFYTEHVLPVMRPEFASRLVTADALLRETLIADESTNILPFPPTWALWFAEAGVPTDDLSVELSFTQADHALDAALSGAGVTLARMSIARQALHAGTLVAPFRTVLQVSGSIRFVCPHGHEKRPAVRAFMAFFTDEAAKDEGLLAERTIHFVG